MTNGVASTLEQNITFWLVHFEEKKGGQDCVTDDLMNNIYNNSIVGFNLKCGLTKKKMIGG